MSVPFVATLMAEPSDRYPRASARDGEDRYRRFTSDAGAAFRRAVAGTDRSHGWTDPAQAELIAGRLALAPGARLLDLGAGRGWPGGLIAERTGAWLVSVDVPVEALRQGAEWFAARLPDAARVCADGRALPFGDAHFSAVCHADVLC